MVVAMNKLCEFQIMTVQEAVALQIQQDQQQCRERQAQVLDNIISECYLLCNVI